MKQNILVTGGAGFIGSNLVAKLLSDPRINKVRVLDNLSNGCLSNMAEFIDNSRFEFIEGDIRNYDTCLAACQDIDKVSHQAALGSVPRSIMDPVTSTNVNISGTINILHAAHQQNVERVILACSSSTYGDHPALPKVEHQVGKPLSPYAVTKAAIEQFADVFGKVYSQKWIGLRYFNVFGPKQSPDNPYAAVIPIFLSAALNDKRITINGNGDTARDFTYIDNVVAMNILSLFTDSPESLNQVYNVACGEMTSLNELTEIISQIMKKPLTVSFGPNGLGMFVSVLPIFQKQKNYLVMPQSLL